MKKLLFLGACDKTDVVLYIAKLLTTTEAKVLLLDATKDQRYRYSIPEVKNAKEIVEVNGFDVAFDYTSETAMKDILKEGQYDYLIIDTDNPDFFKVKWNDISKHYLVSTYENYTIQKNKELLSALFNQRSIKDEISFTQIIFDMDVSIDVNYIDTALSDFHIQWEETHFISFDEENVAVKIENQFSNRIRLKGLSRGYKKTLMNMIENVTELTYSNIKRTMKLAERSK